jgi:trk system potassium uptake protein TrkH
MGYYIFEADNLLSKMNLKDKIIASVFSSVTPRTAGFNTIDIGALTPASKLITIILMYIGGSPGSTAGGIKTATFAVILISVWSSLRSTKHDNIFGRRLEDNALKRASAVAAINLVLSLIAAILICASNTALSLDSVIFEVISAIGTVGLSTGITGDLNNFARIIIVLLMYCGRVGSVSFALIFTEHKIPSNIDNPMEKINIG